jgi:sec-independent protein translocase protein TatA
MGRVPPTLAVKGALVGFLKNIGAPELLIILVVILLIFGAAKLPSLARSLGASAKEFRKGMDEGADEEEEEGKEEAEAT